MSLRNKKDKGKIHHDSKRNTLIDTYEGDFICQFDDDFIGLKDEITEGKSFAYGCLFFFVIIILTILAIVGIFFY